MLAGFILLLVGMVILFLLLSKTKLFEKVGAWILSFIDPYQQDDEHQKKG